VSIGLPVYNAERYLEPSLRSLLSQDVDGLQVVVCDNASMDRTWQICNDLAGSDRRAVLHRNDTNIGVHRNFNLVVQKSSGQFFKWAAADDLCASSLVRRCLERLVDDPGIVLAFPRTLLIDGHGTVVEHFDDELNVSSRHASRRVASFALRWNLANAVYGVIRRDYLDRTGLIRPYRHSDITLLAELAALGRFVLLPDELFQRRMHAASVRDNPDASVRKDHGRLEIGWETAFALLGSDLPRSTRLACAAAHTSVWTYRCARVEAGLFRRRLMPARDDPPAV